MLCPSRKRRDGLFTSAKARAVHGPSNFESQPCRQDRCHGEGGLNRRSWPAPSILGDDRHSRASGRLCISGRASRNALSETIADRIAAVANEKSGSPTWIDIRGALSRFDRAGLLGLVQDLYAASQHNQAFLHARLGLGQDQLEPYKARISRWISPDLTRNQAISISKAKKAISDYKKAIGRPEGMAELSTFYCEEALDFLESCGVEEEGYFLTLIRMYDRSLKLVLNLPAADRAGYLERLDKLRSRAGGLGWGVQDVLNDSWHEVDLDGQHE